MITITSTGICCRGPTYKIVNDSPFFSFVVDALRLSLDELGYTNQVHLKATGMGASDCSRLLVLLTSAMELVKAQQILS